MNINYKFLITENVMSTMIQIDSQGVTTLNTFTISIYISFFSLEPGYQEHLSQYVENLGRSMEDLKVEVGFAGMCRLTVIRGTQESAIKIAQTIWESLIAFCNELILTKESNSAFQDAISIAEAEVFTGTISIAPALRPRSAIYGQIPIETIGEPVNA